MDMVSKKIIAGVVILVVVLVIVGIFVLPLITSSPAAVLEVTSGEVEVNQRAASDGSSLRQGDRVRTLSGAAANIVLFGASVVRLDENTEVEIVELKEGDDNRFRLRQISGNTWSRVTQLSNFNSYVVETPDGEIKTTGTAFSCIIDRSTCSVIQGSAIVTVGSEGASVEAGQTASLGEGLEVTDLIESVWIDKNSAIDEEFLTEVREKIKSKYSTYIPLIKSELDVTDEELDEALDDFLEGEYSQDQYESALAELEKRGIQIKI
jgi:ferric-dicitrate binding protein FerR (iron transport regulator)